MIFKKALINFAMIQTTVFATSISLGLQIPTTDGSLIAIAFVYMFAFFLSLLPSVLVSFAFAALSK